MEKGCFGSGYYDGNCELCLSAQACESLNFNHTIRKEYGKQKWFLKRKEIISRDKKCVKCGGTHSLNVHHINPVTEFFSLFYSNSNLETLCETCHVNEHKKRLESYLNYVPYEYEEEDWRNCDVCGKLMYSKYRTCYECQFGGSSY